MCVCVCADAMSDVVQTKVGVTQFSDAATLSVSIGTEYSSDAFATAVRNIPFGGGFTATWDGIAVGAADLVAHGRPAAALVPKAMMIITDGQSETASV